MTIPLSSLNPSLLNPGSNKSLVQVIVSAPNLDSFTASPSLLRMASSLMENPTFAELINTPCETGPSDENGEINLYGVKAATSVKGAESGGSSGPNSFYYRDPRLPAGWYVGLEATASGGLVIHYYTPTGERLRSLSEVAHFLQHKLVVLPSCRGVPPPRPVHQLPALADLSPENRALVPSIVLPVVDAGSPVIRQIDSEIISAHTSLKRPATALTGPQEDKKSKIVFF